MNLVDQLCNFIERTENTWDNCIFIGYGLQLILLTHIQKSFGYFSDYYVIRISIYRMIISILL